MWPPDRPFRQVDAKRRLKTMQKHLIIFNPHLMATCRQYFSRFDGRYIQVLIFLIIGMHQLDIQKIISQIQTLQPFKSS